MSPAINFYKSALQAKCVQFLLGSNIEIWTIYKDQYKSCCLPMNRSFKGHLLIQQPHIVLTYKSYKWIHSDLFCFMSLKVLSSFDVCLLQGLTWCENYAPALIADIRNYVLVFIPYHFQYTNVPTFVQCS